MKNFALRHLVADPGLLAILQASPVGIYYADAVGNCTYTNPAWQKLYGLTGDEACGSGWNRTVHPDDLPWVVNAWQTSVARGCSFFAEFRIQNNSEICVIRSMATPVYDERRKIIGFSGSVEDVTTYKIQQAREAANNFVLNLIIIDRPL